MPLSDFKENQRFRLTDIGDLKPVGADMHRRKRRSARLVDQLFFTRLLANPAMSDGKPLFSSNHRNLLTGATSAFSADSLKKAGNEGSAY